MVGIVIVTHRNVADELLQIAIRHYGEEACANIRAVGVLQKLGVQTVIDQLARAEEEAFLQSIVKPAIEKAVTSFIDKGEKVIVLTDMFGGTPCNLSLGLCSTRKVDLVSGVNLPMLFALIEANQPDLNAAVALALETGSKAPLIARHAVSEVMHDRAAISACKCPNTSNSVVSEVLGDRMGELFGVCADCCAVRKAGAANQGCVHPEQHVAVHARNCAA